jgi:hypothetical protein
MMIKKIISSGQTGAERAALDVALKLNIPHGGWLPKGRSAEDGPLSDKYQLQEMPTDSYPVMTEQNVIDSDGTLIIARTKLTGRPDYTREMTLKHKKQLLGIDLNQINHHDAASLVASWIQLYKIKALNVAGPRASQDLKIYSEVFKILEYAIQILANEESKCDKKIESNRKKQFPKPPKTVDEAVKRLISEMSLKDKTVIANMAEIELSVLHTTLGEYIRNEYGLWKDNKDLLTSCCFIAKRNKASENEASSIIIKELWKRLRKTHKMRIVK